MGQLDFRPGTRVYIDTAPLIYTVEQHAEYAPLLQPVWQSARQHEIEIVTSELTLLEALVLPLRQNDEELIATHEAILTNSEINVLPVSAAVLREAARLRATHNLKTPDAIHSATASLSNCDFLVANDATFRRLSNIEIVILSDLV